MTIWSSLALPTNFAQGSEGDKFFCFTNNSASFSFVEDSISTVGCTGGECLSSPLGLLKHSPWNSPFSFKVGYSHFRCPTSPHCQHLNVLPASCPCWGFLALGWSVAQEWVCGDRPLPLEPPLHEPWGCLSKPHGLAPLEEDCVDFTIEAKYLTCPTKATI